MFQPKAILDWRVFLKLVPVGLIALIAGVGSGCNSTECVIVEPLATSNPWVGPNERATTQACHVQRFLIESAYDYVVWTDENGREFDSRAMTAQAEAFLKDMGHERTHLTGQLPPPPFGMFVEDREVYREVPLVEPAWTIVSVDPLVLVKTKGAVYYYLSQGQASWVHSTTGWEGTPKVYILLPRGFVFGTRLAFSEDAEWFSPDMGVGPQPLDEVQAASGKYRIPVPWGALILRREADELVVSAEANGE